MNPKQMELAVTNKSYFTNLNDLFCKVGDAITTEPGLAFDILTCPVTNQLLRFKHKGPAAAILMAKWLQNRKEEQ